MKRRIVLKAGLGFGIGLRLAPTLALGQDDPASIRPNVGDLLVKADDSSLKPLTPADIPVGAQQTLAWAMAPDDKTVRAGSRLNLVILLRLDAGTFSPQTQSMAAEGVVAYTAICPHTGCEVVHWLEDEQLLSCECHMSTFDPKDGARVVDGPAPRALPALPLKVVDGRLVVAKPFTARVGFESA